MVASCPVCGYSMEIQPGYQQWGTVYEFAICDNRGCPVQSVRIEWRMP